MSKPKILCIVGESGSGKTSIADFIEQQFNIPMIQSHTERPPRYEGENGHTFHDDDAYDNLKTEDKLAETKINGYFYWCETKDVDKPLMTYVIDESGLVMLTNRFHDMFDITSLRVLRDLTLREQYVDSDRLERDVNFFLPLDKYDYIIRNDASLPELHSKIKDLIEVLYGDDL